MFDNDLVNIPKDFVRSRHMAIDNCDSQEDTPTGKIPYMVHEHLLANIPR